MQKRDACSACCWNSRLWHSTAHGRRSSRADGEHWSALRAAAMLLVWHARPVRRPACELRGRRRALLCRPALPAGSCRRALGPCPIVLWKRSQRRLCCARRRLDGITQDSELTRRFAEMFDPTRPARGSRSVLRLATLLGVGGGFLLAYQRSSCEYRLPVEPAQEGGEGTGMSIALSPSACAVMPLDCSRTGSGIGPRRAIASCLSVALNDTQHGPACRAALQQAPTQGGHLAMPHAQRLHTGHRPLTNTPAQSACGASLRTRRRQHAQRRRAPRPRAWTRPSPVWTRTCAAWRTGTRRGAS